MGVMDYSSSKSSPMETVFVGLSDGLIDPQSRLVGLSNGLLGPQISFVGLGFS